MMTRPAARRILPFATAVCAGAIFVADTLTTTDIAFCTLYSAIVLMAARSCSAKAIIAVAAGCVALTISSFLLSSPGGSAYEWINTIIGLSAMGLITLLAVQQKAAEVSLREQTSEISKLNKELATRAKELETSNSQLERLRQLEADLAHANRVATMGQMTASIAHEMNQPIGAARNNAASGLRFLFKIPPDLDGVREALERAMTSAERAGEIIDRIRAHIKKAPPQDERLDMNETISGVIELVRGEAVKNRVSVQMKLGENLPRIRGDRVQLQQVVINLVLNAVEAMSPIDDAPREVSLSTERRGASEILVAVRDTGPGIHPNDRERVFDSFHTTKVNGMGLGLSICRSIIDAHQGRLWADANEPRGLVLQFTLPAAS